MRSGRESRRASGNICPPAQRTLLVYWLRKRRPDRPVHSGCRRLADTEGGDAPRRRSDRRPDRSALAWLQCRRCDGPRVRARECPWRQRNDGMRMELPLQPAFLVSKRSAVTRQNHASASRAASVTDLPGSPPRRPRRRRHGRSREHQSTGVPSSGNADSAPHTRRRRCCLCALPWVASDRQLPLPPKR